MEAIGLSYTDVGRLVVEFPLAIVLIFIAYNIFATNRTLGRNISIALFIGVMVFDFLCQYVSNVDFSFVVPGIVDYSITFAMGAFSGIKDWFSRKNRNNDYMVDRELKV